MSETIVEKLILGAEVTIDCDCNLDPKSPSWRSAHAVALAAATTLGGGDVSVDHRRRCVTVGAVSD